MRRSRHPVDDIADGIKTLERKISTGTPAQRASSRYQLAVLLLSKYSWTYEAKLLSQAREQLNRVIEIRPKHARFHGALGYAYDLSESGAERALACFREAHRLNPRDGGYDVYVLTLLQETGREQEALAEIEAAAPRHGVDLHALRRDLAEAGMPSDAGALSVDSSMRATSSNRRYRTKPTELSTLSNQAARAERRTRKGDAVSRTSESLSAASMHRGCRSRCARWRPGPHATALAMTFAARIYSGAWERSNARRLSAKSTSARNRFRHGWTASAAD